MSRRHETVAEPEVINHHSVAGYRTLNDNLIQSDLLEVLPDLCFVLDRQGRVLEVNSIAVTTLGRERSALVGSEFSSLVDPSFEPRFRSSLGNCVTQREAFSDETHLAARDGSAVPVALHLSCYPPGTPSERSVCLVVARDISETKSKELDLLLFYNIAHYTVNPVEITGTDGAIIYVNPAFEKASGFAKEDLLGKNPNVFSSGKHPKSFWQRMWKDITSGKVWVGEIENKRRNGEPFFTQLLISPVIDGKGKIIGYFGVHRDITQQKHLEQQLIQAQKMESIGLLAAGLAHEVGNPLTSISSLVQVLQRETKDAFTLNKLELIKSQISRISRIIRDLVDFSRRSSYEVQLTDVNKGLREAIEIVRVGKKAKEISFKTQLGENLPHLPLVPDQIEQVFINMLINAVDAIHEGAIYAQREKKQWRLGQIAVTSFLDDDQLTILIEDNGKGIADNDLPKIFEAFFTTKKVGEGTGLGLWVSYGIIKSFEGNITVHSKEWQGTTFTITLPLRSQLK